MCSVCIHLTFGTLTIDHNQKNVVVILLMEKNVKFKVKKKNSSLWAIYNSGNKRQTICVCVCIDGIF